MKKTSILFIDSCEKTRHLVFDKLDEKEGYEVFCYRSAWEAKKYSRELKPNFIVIDHQLPETDCRTLVQELEKISPRSTILLTGSGVDEKRNSDFFRSAVKEFVPKTEDFVKKLKIVVDQLSFSKMYGEEFSEDVLTIDSNNGSATSLILGVLLLIIMVLITFLIWNF